MTKQLITMKILLLGDYSGLHVNLAEGLRVLGHSVTIASAGSHKLNFKRDIDLRQPTKNKRIKFLQKIARALPQLRGYDIVQMIHHNFLDTNPHFAILLYEYIKANNKHCFLGVNATDYYTCKASVEGKQKYSTLTIPELQNDPYVKLQLNHMNNKRLVKSNIRIARECKGITACSYGYYQGYADIYPEKVIFIPLPINTTKHAYLDNFDKPIDKVRFFLGKTKGREVFKGADVIEPILKDLKKKYPNDVELKIVTSIPFDEYQKLMNESHILCDQRYSTGIGMNGALSMSKGIITGSGATNEMYDALGEYENRPIVNLRQAKEELHSTFEHMIAHKRDLKEHSLRSRDFVVKHHDYIKVAQQYLDFWTKN